jgi:hypothetical protein
MSVYPARFSLASKSRVRDSVPSNDGIMKTPDSNTTMAVYLDLENIALGAQDAHFPAFNVQKVFERLLLKGTSW